MEQIAAVLSAILIAAVSAWITVQLSLRRFRVERWWERRVDAYSRTTEALHNSKAFSDQSFEAAIEDRELPEEEERELRSRARAARDEILKTMDVGAFLLSDEALSRLQQYQKEEAEAEKQGSWFEYLDSDLAATNKCLKDMIKIAKKDLGTA